jgi:hypothetical protein
MYIPLMQLHTHERVKAITIDHDLKNIYLPIFINGQTPLHASPFSIHKQCTLSQLHTTALLCFP